MYKRSRSEGFGEEVKRRIMIGTYALAAGFYDAYCRKEQKSRRLVKEDYARAFEEVDVIIGPTTFKYDFKDLSNKMPIGEIDLDEVHKKLGD